MTSKNVLTDYRTIRIKAEKAWQPEMYSHPMEQSNQGWKSTNWINALTSYMKNSKSQGWDGMTNRNALTNYGMIRIKAEKAWQAEMHSHPMEQ